MREPNQTLAVHVVHQALRDLDITPKDAVTEQAIYEARLWWLKDTGPWKRSRVIWLELARFDPEKATEEVRKKLQEDGITLDSPIPQTPVPVFTQRERHVLRHFEPFGEVFYPEGKMKKAMDKFSHCFGRLTERGTIQKMDNETFMIPADLNLFARAETG